MFAESEILRVLRPSATRIASLLISLSLMACDGNGSVAKGSSVVDQSSCLVVDKTLVEMGKVGTADIVSTSTVISNGGSSDVKINSIETDCPCVSVTMDKETLRPNETGRIRIEFDANGSYDKQYHLVTINGDNGQTINICVTADVVTTR